MRKNATDANIGEPVKKWTRIAGVGHGDQADRAQVAFSVKLRQSNVSKICELHQGHLSDIGTWKSWGSPVFTARYV